MGSNDGLYLKLLRRVPLASHPLSPPGDGDSLRGYVGGRILSFGRVSGHGRRNRQFTRDSPVDRAGRSEVSTRLEGVHSFDPDAQVRGLV